MPEGILSIIEEKKINVVIHAQLPLRMPCYDFILVTDLSLGPA